MNTLARTLWTFSLQKGYHYVKGSMNNKKDLNFVDTYTVKEGYCKGVKLRLNQAFIENFKSIIEGSYEDFLIKALLEKTDLQGKTIWDIGAHIGYQSFSFAKEAGQNGLVYSFEPNPNNFKNLQENLNLNPEINTIKPKMLAISDKRAEMPFNISKHKNHPTSLGGYLSDITPPEDMNAYKDFETVVVQVESIDNLVYRENLKVPDIIKIDIEGAELNALIGAKKVLENSKPIFVIEIHTISMMFHVLGFFAEFNYNCEIIDDHINFFTKNIICTSS